MNFQVNLNICRVCMKSEQGQSIMENAELQMKFKFATRLKLNPDDNMPKNICTRCVVRLKVSCDFIELAQASEQTLRAFLDKINNDFQMVTQCNSGPCSQQLPAADDKAEDDMLVLIRKEESPVVIVPHSHQDRALHKQEPGTSLLAPIRRSIDERQRFSAPKRSAAAPSPPSTTPPPLLPSPKIVPEDKLVESEDGEFVLFEADEDELINGDKSGEPGEFTFDTNVVDAVYIDEPSGGQHEPAAELEMQIMDKGEVEADDDYMAEFVVMLEDNPSHEPADPEVIEPSTLGDDDDDDDGIEEMPMYDLQPEPQDHMECIVETDELVAAPINAQLTDAHVGQASGSTESRTRPPRKTRAAPPDSARFYCVQCNRDFSTKTNLTRHMASHDGLRPYQCQICDKKFTQNGSLKQHMYTHTGEKPFVCKYCERGFTQCKSLVFHMRRHTGDKPFHCEHCGIFFRQKDGLRMHILRSHTITKEEGGTRTHTCIICKQELATHQDLQVHMKKHVNSSTAAADKSAVPTDLIDESRLLNEKALLEDEQLEHDCEEESAIDLDPATSSVLDIVATSTDVVSRAKKFQCRKCFKCFAIKRNLIRHFAIHDLSLSEWLQCDTCESIFNTKEALHSHQQRAHKMDNAFDLFECIECQLAFPTQNDLQEHLESTHAELNYLCPACPDAHFNTQKLFMAHMLVHELQDDDEE